MSIEEEKILDKAEFKLLYKALLKLRTEEEIKSFLRDLCSMKELENIATRVSIAQMLIEKKPYIEIERLLGCSSASIAKISDTLKYGYDGIKTALDRFKS